MADIQKTFGAHLKGLRNERKWSQEKLAEKAGMHFTYVGQIERGKRNPSLINLNKLAKAFGLTLSELMEDI